MNCVRSNSSGFQPIPAFCVMPKMLPLGSSISISLVTGRLPSGPSADKSMSHMPVLVVSPRIRACPESDAWSLLVVVMEYPFTQMFLAGVAGVARCCEVVLGQSVFRK